MELKQCHPSFRAKIKRRTLSMRKNQYLVDDPYLDTKTIFVRELMHTYTIVQSRSEFPAECGSLIIVMSMIIISDERGISLKAFVVTTLLVKCFHLFYDST